MLTRPELPFAKSPSVFAKVKGSSVAAVATIAFINPLVLVAAHFDASIDLVVC